MKNQLLLLLAAASLLFISSCGGDDGVNASPEVVNPIQDITIGSGFGSSTANLNSVFSDSDGDFLNYTAESSNTDVVTVTVNNSNLTITEQGLGMSTITVTADDSNGGTATDTFVVIVEESICDNDNTLNLDNTVCDNTPEVSNAYTETVSMGMRTIVTNRVPDHDYGNQISRMGVTGLVSTSETFTFTSNPSLANSTTSILDANNRPSYDYGIALNGVPIDPAPAEPFIFENPNNGEYNWDWVFEPNNNRTAVGLDCNTAHLQPTDDNTKGLIHYHGDMVVYANSLLAGLGDGSTTPTTPVQIGWASDGFPIFYKYGPTSDGSGVELLESSYQLKSGERGGDGVTAPCGPYNGKYTNDYEWVQGVGDLDECNGISRSVTLFNGNTQENETFSYFYVITDEFPIIGRCISGTPASDFSKRP